MEVEIQIINAFVEGDKGGNAAGVVLDSDGLTATQKQLIAQQAGFSETAFVSGSNVADFKLEFFTPARQIAHCGHATIATFSYLDQINRLSGSKSSKETIDGTREIIIKDGLAFMEQSAPFYKDLNDLEGKVLKSVGIGSDDLINGLRPLLVNTGNSFIIIPIKDISTIKAITPDLDSISAISEELGLIGYYLFILESEIAGRDASTRMFAPYYGIKEESATGMAAGPLACYLNDIAGISKDSFLIEQGYFMEPPSPSVIQVDLIKDHGRITKLLAGGKGLRMGSKLVQIS